VPVTVGVDIGTTAVKALAADDDGTVLARCRVPHPLRTPMANVLEHDAALAWRDGVRTAVRRVAEEVASTLKQPVEAIQVAAMVPSLCPVDAGGVPIGPGLLYGDERAKGGERGLDPSRDGELLRMVEWLAGEYPDAAGFWPAQAVGIAALCGHGVIDPVTAMTASPLFDLGTCDWDASVCGAAGVGVERLPEVWPSGEAAGTALEALGPALRGTQVGTGTIDAFAEQLVAGADHDGDVLVILGATLITWACIPNWVEAPGLWTVPHTAPGKTLIGGPSNAGGILRDWAGRVLQEEAGGAGASDPSDVPVVLPYLRGERTPLHDPERRGTITGISLAHGPAALWRSVREASGHSVRHHLDLAGLLPSDGCPGECGTVARRIVATGGGVRDRAWVQAIADVTALPVDVVAVPEGGALGAAYLARVTAGAEPDASGASRWAAVGERIEPDIAWVGPCSDRYRTFRELSGPPYDSSGGAP